MKPASSRSQSAEIFVVGRNYKAPDFIDSRMLEPKHAFRQDYDVEGGFPCPCRDGRPLYCPMPNFNTIGNS